MEPYEHSVFCKLEQTYLPSGPRLKFYNIYHNNQKVLWDPKKAQL